MSVDPIWEDQDKMGKLVNRKQFEFSPSVLVFGSEGAFFIARW